MLFVFMPTYVLGYSFGRVYCFSPLMVVVLLVLLFFYLLVHHWIIVIALLSGFMDVLFTGDCVQLFSVLHELS